MILDLLELNKTFSKILKKQNFKKVFIISGKKTFYLHGINRMLVNLLKYYEYEIFLKKKSFPEIAELKKILFRLDKFKPDLIIAVGGGSVIDYAKIANNITSTSKLKEKISNSKLIFRKRAQLIALPTTAGSGAEVTPNAVLYINKIKHSIENFSLQPDKFILIPKLIIKCNKEIRASSGFDAIAQAIESLMSRKSNSKSIKFAIASLKLSLKNFLKFVKKPTMQNAKQMSKAANFAGEAIAISRTTAPHALSYPFTAHYGLSHGRAVSITFNEFIRFNYFNKDKSKTKFNINLRFNKLFKVSNTKNIFEFDKLLNVLKADSGVALKRGEIDQNKNLIKKILKEINIQRLKNNPVDLKKEDLKKILFESLRF